jgi:hypothetical protein
VTFRAVSIDHQIDHPSQADVQAAAHEKLFQGLALKTKIDTLAAEFASQVQAYEPDPKKAEKQARRWIIEALCDYVAMGEYELVFIDESDDDDETKTDPS